MAEVEERQPSGSGAADELRRQLVDVHEQLVERDQEFRYWRDQLRSRDKKIEALERHIEPLERDNAELRAWAEGRIAELEVTIESIQSTRLWRLAARYWSLRGRARRLLRRSA